MKRKHYLHWNNMAQIIIGRHQARGTKIRVDVVQNGHGIPEKKRKEKEM